MLAKIKVLFIVLITTSSTLVMASERQAVAYEKVISCEGRESGEILQAIVEYFSRKGNADLTQSDQQVTTTGNLKIYNYIISAIKNPAGEIAFDLKIDVKDGKFRCIMHNIEFIHFERDRYGKFGATGEKPIRLSEEKVERSLSGKIERQAMTYLNNMVHNIKESIVDNSEETDW